jgi:mycothiol synthase
MHYNLKGVKTMELSMRNYHDETDYWRIRQFLRDVMIANGLHEYSWSVMRLDYWRYFGMNDIHPFATLPDIIFIWETPAGQIASVLNPEEPGNTFIQIHPAFKTKELEAEMIATAAERLSVVHDDKRRLFIWADSLDTQRQEILKAHGFTMQNYTESQWRRDLDIPIPEVPVAGGYTVRSLGDKSELPARSWASWRGFHPNEPDEKYRGWE